MWWLTNLSETDIFHMSLEWLLPGTANNTAGSIRRPSEALQGQPIKTAWNGISPASNIRAFKECCV